MAVAVGERLLIAKQKATARYVGGVEGHEGTWVGVEWDDPSRGKHDGSVGGKRYFSCQSAAPTAGSFIRINKVSQGISLVDALVLRYTNQLAEGQTGGDGQVYLHTAAPSKVNFRLVGEDQVTEWQRRIDLLKSARLVGANVSRVGPPGALAAAAPSLTQLDLTDNLIGGWATIMDICQQLPNLRLLVVSHNKLQLPNTVDEAVQQELVQLPGLHGLVINHCGITWQQVGVVQSYLPSLKELHVGGNSISSLYVDLQQQRQQQVEGGGPAASVPAALAGFMSLQILGLEDNTMSEWSEVLRLAGLPSLKRLSLSGNPVSSIRYPTNSIPPSALLHKQPPGAAEAEAPAGSADGQIPQQQHKPFAALEALLLGGCQISGWADIDALNRFPSLHECRLSGNPLFTVDGPAAGAGRRFEVIGRVASLTLLNGADVKPRERRDSELRYIMYIAGEAEDATTAGNKQEPEQQAVQHPRLAELQTKYGKLSAVAARPGLAGTTISATTAALKLQHGSSTVSKKLPKTISISALKLLCARLFKLPPDQLQLLLKTGDGSQQSGAEDIGQDDTKTLQYWDVSDNRVIEVVHVDPRQLRQQLEQEQLAKQQQHEHRMAQQLQQGEVIRTAAER